MILRECSPSPILRRGHDGSAVPTALEHAEAMYVLMSEVPPNCDRVTDYAVALSRLE